MRHPYLLDGSSSGPCSHSGPVIHMDSPVQPSTEELVSAAVTVARNAGLSWDAIGKILGVDSQTASGRYASFSWAEGSDAHA